MERFHNKSKRHAQNRKNMTKKQIKKNGKNGKNGKSGKIQNEKMKKMKKMKKREKYKWKNEKKWKNQIRNAKICFDHRGTQNKPPFNHHKKLKILLLTVTKSYKIFSVVQIFF